ncbi:head maturation protease, ClpP-related [Brevibacillus fulvus]|uniref:ATP-dependent Clp protease proteolytic subunit n=1 Tax=Brevibacillus fulvus TaxID=1125967 RepID=A0A939BU77_9BACL|nr:head maturation protease, ClpP-related [Brevibacillus fulvus]MBM7592263.1 ATP-dependent Clp endopeptidase proteolytic subunit ClpP [Brevibacillus fulvus]
MAPKLKFWNLVNTDTDNADLYVYGTITNGDGWIYEWFGMEATDQVEFIRELNALGTKKNINVYINSDGGDVYAAHTIHNVLKRNPANITVYIDGIAASAASIIAMAGDVVKMPVNSTLMIHDPLIGISGYFNAQDLDGMKDLLDQVKNGIIAAYAAKSNITEKEISKMMSRQTYLTAKEAVEMGFADEILYDKQIEVVNAGKYVIVNSLSFEMDKLIGNPILQNKPGRMDPMQVPTQAPNVTNAVQTPVNSAPVADAPVAVTSPPSHPTPAPAATPIVNTIDFAAQERARLKAIDEIAANIDPELVNEAKYGDNPMTAEQLAFRAMKEGKMRNTGIFEAAIQANKTAGTEGVLAQAQHQGNEKEYDLNNIKDVNAIFAQIAASSHMGRL